MKAAKSRAYLFLKDGGAAAALGKAHESEALAITRRHANSARCSFIKISEPRKCVTLVVIHHAKASVSEDVGVSLAFGDLAASGCHMCLVTGIKRMAGVGAKS